MSKKKQKSSDPRNSKQTQFTVERPNGRPCTVSVTGEMDQEEKEFIDQFIADNDDCFGMIICPITSDEAKDMLNDKDEDAK